MLLLFGAFSSYSQQQLTRHDRAINSPSKEKESSKEKQINSKNSERFFEEAYRSFHQKRSDRLPEEYHLSKRQINTKNLTPPSAVPLGPVTLADSSALVAIYNALSGPTWNNNTNWLQPGQNVETWYGVTVVGDRVTGLDLSNNNLFGIIPPEIGDLDQLVTLNFFNNSINDVLPSELGNLGSLQTLDLSQNQLFGEVPASFLSLISLNYLNLSENSFDGDLLIFTALTSLNNLFLSGNFFYGSIPSEIELLSNLVQLDLSFNSLDGALPTTLGNLTNLQYLRLSANGFTGTLPVELANLSNLTDLLVDSNAIGGTIPTEYSNLNQLQTIDLLYNQFGGDFPDALLSISSLQGIFISGNQFSGTIPDLSALPNLLYLIIDDNQFSGPIPPTIGNNTNLVWLNIGGNDLEGPIPPEFGNLTNLQLLRIWQMPLVNGDIPSELGNLTNLIEADMAYNSFTGALPGELGALSELQIFWLQGNELTGSVPSSFTGLTSLATFSIRDNNIDGLPNLTSLSPILFDVSLNLIPQADITLNASVITDNIGQKIATIDSDSLALVALYEFTNGDSWINNSNWLEGPVYGWYGITSADGRVREISLFNNNLRPSSDAPELFPDELADLTQLTTFDISSNFLSSGADRKFTDEFYSLPSLTEVRFSGCGIGGVLPPDAFSNVNHLEIPANRFEGGLDFILNSSTFIDYCNVASNNFSDLPDISGVGINFLDASFNNLTFEDFEPNIGSIPSFIYSPQRIYGEDSIIYDLASTLNLDFTTGGSANDYQWFLDGDTLVGQTLPTIGINPGEDGDYQLKANNSLVPGLTLESGRYRITTAPPFNQTPSNIFHSYQIQVADESIRSSVNAGDMNGDGIDDIAVANSASIDIYFGDRLLSGNTPDITFELEGEERIGVLAAGIYNTDAFSDVVFTKYVNNDEDNTNALVVLEGANGLNQSNINSVEFSFAGSAAEFGLVTFDNPLNVVNLGDLNNDGFDEVGISTGGFSSAGSDIIIYFGGQATFDGLSDFVTPPANGSFAYKMFELGDVNGDNIDDFGVVNPNFASNPEIYAIYFGGIGKTDFVNADLLVDFTSSTFNDNQQFMWSSTSADVNGDTFSDILFRHFNNNDPNFPLEGTHSLHVIYGGPGMDNLIDDAFLLPGNSDDLRNIDRFGGTQMVNVGDYDGDGNDDILIPSFANSRNGHMFSANNLSENTIPDKIINAADQNFNLGPGNNFVSFQTENAIGDFNDNGLIDLVLSQPTDDGYTLYFYENFEPPGDLFYDSIALVDLYESTDGDNWSNNSNWLSGNINTWNGVGVATSRVVSVDLSGNGLSGDLTASFDKLQNLQVLNLSDNELSGSISSSINQLPNLTTIDLSNNEISAIPDFNNSIAPGLNTINLSSNRLTFDDLEPVVNLSSINYANQKNIQLNQSDTVLVPVGRDQIISVSTGGTDNTYRWRYLGSNISGTEAENTSFIVENIDRSNMGSYSVSVENGNVPGLTLLSDPIDVLATAVVKVSVLDLEDELLTDEVSGSLMETVRKTRGYDTLVTADNVASEFEFAPAILKGYLVGITSDPAQYVDTYFQSVFLWEEADVLELFTDTTISINMTVIPQPTQPGDGEGNVSGTIEEDFDDESGRIDARRRAARRKCGLRRKRSGGRNGQDSDDFELFAYGETNDQGEFEFGFLPQGTYRFFVEYPGIPLDEASFVEFEIGEAGVTDDSFVLAATVTPDGIVVELILGITSEFFTDFNIYPNPTVNVVHIDYDKIISNKVTMDLVDMNGKTLLTQELEKVKNGKIQLDLEAYQKGQYLLRFYDSKKNKSALTFRIIKQ